MSIKEKHWTCCYGWIIPNYWGQVLPKKTEPTWPTVVGNSKPPISVVREPIWNTMLALTWQTIPRKLPSMGETQPGPSIPTTSAGLWVKSGDMKQWEYFRRKQKWLKLPISPTLQIFGGRV